jgi:hypothetical protein
MDYTTVSINFYPPRRHEVVLQGQKVANSSVMPRSLADLVTSVKGLAERGICIYSRKKN